MLKYNTLFKKNLDSFLYPISKFLYKALGLTPNKLSAISFLFGSASVIFILFKSIELSLILLILTMVFDLFDGMVARTFKMESKFGEKLDLILDTTNETMIFFALAVGGLAQYKLSFLAIIAIILVRTLREKARFDPGFKRVVLFLGYFTNFNLALQIIFLVNLAGFVINMLILDYKEQMVLDAKNGE